MHWPCIRGLCSVSWCLAEGQWNRDQRRPMGRKAREGLYSLFTLNILLSAVIIICCRCILHIAYWCQVMCSWKRSSITSWWLSGSLCCVLIEGSNAYTEQFKVYNGTVTNYWHQNTSRYTALVLICWHNCYFCFSCITWRKLFYGHWHSSCFYS